MPPPPPPAPPLTVTESFLSTLDLDFLNLAGLSAFTLMIIYFIYSCYQHKYSHRNRDMEAGSQRRAVGPSPPTADSSERGAPSTATATAVICTKLFQYGEGGIQGKNADCSICLDEFAEGEVCRMLPKCRHVFHRYCIDRWLLDERHCPLCRSAVRVRVISSYQS